jgi:hypothetical protein
MAVARQNQTLTFSMAPNSSLPVGFALGQFRRQPEMVVHGRVEEAGDPPNTTGADA